MRLLPNNGLLDFRNCFNIHLEKMYELEISLGSFRKTFLSVKEFVMTE